MCHDADRAPRHPRTSACKTVCPGRKPKLIMVCCPGRPISSVAIHFCQLVIFVILNAGAQGAHDVANASCTQTYECTSLGWPGHNHRIQPLHVDTEVKAESSVHPTTKGKKPCQRSAAVNPQTESWAAGCCRSPRQVAENRDMMTKTAHGRFPSQALTQPEHCNQTVRSRRFSSRVVNSKAVDGRRKATW